MRKQLSKVPLETGNMVAYFLLGVWGGFVLGWIIHPGCMCVWPI